MARLATTKTKVRAEALAEETTTNEEGAIAYKLNAHEKLIEQVLGAFWNEDSFYTKGSKTSSSIVDGVKKVAETDPKFVLQLATYARNFLYLRTTPQVLLVEAANIEACKPFVRAYTPKIVKRADELIEVTSYQLARNGGSHKGFPNSLKRGLADAFANFDEYQLNKYDTNKTEVSLGDVVKIVHPVFRGDEEYRRAIYNFLTKDEVSPALTKISALKELLAKSEIDEEAERLIRESHVTWETLISKFGSTTENWERVIPNMGYMALLRNLRNFEQKSVNLDDVVRRISDPEEVRRSKQLPFRFLSAYRNVTDARLQRAINAAFAASLSNVEIPGTMAVLVDVSGSMTAKVSNKSSVSYKDVGATLGYMAVLKSHYSTVVPFGNTAEEIRIDPDGNPMDEILNITTADDRVGWSTNAWTAFDLIQDRDFDRIVLISDMQCYDSTGWRGNDSVRDRWRQYVKTHPNSYLYHLDLAAYGTSQTASNDRNVVMLNGWSDKVLDYMTLAENRGRMLEEIRKY